MGLRLLSILLLLCLSKSEAQPDSLITDYIQTFPEKITTRASLVNTSNSFLITDKASNTTIKLEPNTRQYLGFSILFRSLEIDFGFAPTFIRENKDNENSKLFNLNMRMFLGQWMQTLDLYSQRGFTAQSSGETNDLPEFKTFTIGGSTSYVFNDKFSFRAVGFQNEWQKKSAGSFIPRLFYYYTSFNPLPNEDNIHSIDVAVTPSYYYNFVIQNHFLIGVGAGLGVGLNINTFEEESLTSALFEYVGRLSVGYNSEHFFAGMNSNITAFDHNANRTTKIEDSIKFVEFYIGYRFDAPKSMLRLADKINAAIGL